MTVLEYMKDHILYLDGGMGTLLQEAGLEPGELPERWNITHPEVVQKFNRAYFDTGSNVVNANTFGANGLKFGDEELAAIIKAAVANAKAARAASAGKQEKFIALDVGPCGKLLRPYGDLDFEDAVKLFSRVISLGAAEGVDLVMIETMNDSYETKAALLAARESCDLPVFVSNAYGQDGKLMTGASPAAMVAMLEGMGASAIGANCSLGPAQLAGVVDELLACASVPVLLKPNAGLPREENGRAVYDIAPADFARQMEEMISRGVRIAGGCCGTTPEYISQLVARTASARPLPLQEKNRTCVSSYTHAVCFGEKPLLIGERINPTGKKRFKQALLDNDMDYILQEGVRQQEAGAQLLDVNVGLPDIDESAVLTEAVLQLQAVIDLPLQIDTADPQAMESALRRYNGKALINSVNGKEESMRAIFPLVKKYGGLVVALTLDENGIPATAAGRLAIARRILSVAAEYGLSHKDIVFDTLAMTISADNRAALATLDALEAIKKELGCHTSLGVSNISFGLPDREAINSAFFAMALERGLSAAIMNPFSSAMMKTYKSFCALKGLDENCSEYIAYASAFPQSSSPQNAASAGEPSSALKRAVCRGLKEQAARETEALLASVAPLDIIQNEIIPALDVVGKGFEEKTVYLPQLLMSAEAAKSSFAIIKEAVLKQGSADGVGAGSAGSSGSTGSAGSSGAGAIVIATVRGDIHDIGKNIVKLLLENYGFMVIDLGKDIAPEKIAAAVTKHHAPLAGLSALMTTTVPAMAETISLLREQAPWCRIVVGGAVLNEDYAKKIGADKYAKDAMDTVRYAKELL